MQIEVFIHAKWNRYSEKFDYSVYGSDMTEYGYVLLERRTLEFETPADRELKVRCATAIKMQKNKVLADAHVQAQALQQEIDELLALEFKP